MIWTWSPIALSYRQLRLKPHPLIQFHFFSSFLICFLKADMCISRMASNLVCPFGCFCARLEQNVFCLLVCRCVCACVCAACVAWVHPTWILPRQDVSYHWITLICNVKEGAGEAGKNVSLRALTSFIQEDDANQLYGFACVFLFLYSCFYFKLYELLILLK